MNTIYAALYTSDPYEPSGLIGLFHTAEEYASIKHQQAIADLEEICSNDLWIGYAHRDEAEEQLPILKLMTQEAILAKYPIDLTLTDEQLNEQREVSRIVIGKYDRWT